MTVLPGTTSKPRAGYGLEAQWHIAVLIPAHNEAVLLARCLRSVLAAKAVLPPDLTCDIVVLSDSSSDRTAEIAELCLGVEATESHGLRSHGIVRSVQAGSVGAARAIAAELALSRYPSNLSRCWLANTDADCEVPTQWLVHQIRLADRGITAVAGIIDVDSFAGHLQHVEGRFRRTYKIHEDGTHPHIHGANLGVRADTYRFAGGWSNLRTAEDHDLWRRIGTCGALRISDATLQVRTSGRLLGRAPHGFAEALAAHNHLECLPETAALAALPVEAEAAA